MSGQELRELRHQMGLSQQALAEKLGVQMMAVWRWEVEEKPNGRKISKPMEKLIRQIYLIHT